MNLIYTNFVCNGFDLIGAAKSIYHYALGLRVLHVDDIRSAAIKNLEGRFKKDRVDFTNAKIARDYLKLRIGDEKNEKFFVLFLDAGHKLIESEVLFSGTVDGTAVYPRVVAERALHHGASAVLLAHNHPSCVVEASHADIELTNRIKKALKLIDVHTLDHIIVSPIRTLSFVEVGLM